MSGVSSFSYLLYRDLKNYPDKLDAGATLLSELSTNHTLALRRAHIVSGAALDTPPIRAR